eukprot:scaffold84403_cov36-Tisochrysis_lutea.AAC.3
MVSAAIRKLTNTQRLRCQTQDLKLFLSVNTDLFLRWWLSVCGSASFAGRPYARAAPPSPLRAARAAGTRVQALLER